MKKGVCLIGLDNLFSFSYRFVRFWFFSHNDRF